MCWRANLFSANGFQKKARGGPICLPQISFLFQPKPKHPLFTGGVLVWALYQLGNWKAGKTFCLWQLAGCLLYQLGNWKAGKTDAYHGPQRGLLYQLGNWKAGKTYWSTNQIPDRLYQLGNWKAGKALLAFPLHRLRNRIIRLARKSAFRWKERLSGDSKTFLNAQIRRPLEGKIEHLRRDADAAHLRLPVERLFARQQIAKTPLAENLIGSVCITNSLARFCR